MPNFYVGSIIFIVGAVVGSFLNVCISRIPKRESIIHPPSYCPRCRAAIRFYCNVPLLSYLFLRGRCDSCDEPISFRYFIVELLMACLGVALFYQFGLFIDLDVRIVPDVISLPGILTGLLFAVIGRYLISDPMEIVPTPVGALIGVLVGGGFLLAVAWVYERFTGVEGMGGGDIKLLAMIGAFLGWPSIPLTLFFSSLGGSIIGLSIMLAKGVDRRYALPFAPFLCLGALVYLFFGREIIDFYVFPR
jgi:leader peptidase (prepilin peptidase)/N-methyltransferase